MSKNKVSALELGFILFTVTLAQKVHALPSLLSGYADESLWLVALINFAVDFAFLIIVLNILNKIKGRSFYEVLTEKCGKFLGKVIVFALIIFMILKVFIPFIEQKNSIELTFYETQPTDFTFLPIYIVVFYVSLKGLISYAKSVNVIIWGLILGAITVLLLSLSAVDFNRILPLFAKPLPTLLKGSFKTALWFGDPIFLLFFSKYIPEEEKLNSKIITFYLISMAIYVGGLILFYSVFENIAVRQYFAPLKMSKYSVTLTNIGRFDYFATLLIVTANVYSLSLPLLIASNLLKDLFKFKKEYFAPLIITAISFTLTLFTSHGFFKHLEFTQNYLTYFFIIVTYGLPLLLTLFLRRNNNERI